MSKVNAAISVGIIYIICLIGLGLLQSGKRQDHAVTEAEIRRNKLNVVSGCYSGVLYSAYQLSYAYPKVRGDKAAAAFGRAFDQCDKLEKK